MKRPLSWIAWLVAALAGHAAAQSLPAVTVTATRTQAAPFEVPASVDVIEGDRLRSAGRAEVNLSEGIAGVPGVAARDRQNYAQDLQLSIRGFGARSTFGVRGVRIYVDGIPATMPDGQGQLSHIDLSSAGRVELLRGPFSALYGNSSGGVLQVFTERGAGPPVVSASFATGSDGLSRPSVRASGSTPSLGYSVGASHFTTDGFRDHSGAQRDVANARLDWQHGADSDWMLVANALDLRADDPLGLSRAQFETAPRSVDASAGAFDTRKTVRQSQLGLVNERKLGAGNSLRVMVYGGQRDTQQFQAIPVGAQASPLHPGGVIGLARRYTGADLRWTSKGELAGQALEWVGGVAFDTMDEHRVGRQNFIGPLLGVEGALRRDEDNRVSNLDPYLQGVWKLAPRWTLTGGVRHSSVRFSSSDRYVSGANGDDSGSVRYSATLPAAALMFALAPDTRVYVASGRGFETPTFNELAYRPDGTPGLNFALRPARSANLEAGIKGRGGDIASLRTHWSAAWFRTRTRDEIVTQTNGAGRSTFQNAGTTRREGVELSWSASLAPGWRMQFAQTWLDARYREAFRTCAVTPCAAPSLVVPSGNRIPGTARSTTAAEVAWAPRTGWQAGAELRRSSRVYVNDSNSDAAPAFTTVALNGGYVFDLQPWTLAVTARIDNLLDRRYAGSVIVNEGNGRYFEPAPGRSYIVKFAGSYAF
ncbi:TonB-dependent receptor family protein [Caenimonas aquaedulcis]|uniref:TonB-dependent receptor n=1 Tax=Caenimonas aquaedulcis TaxID=2793270 RepID=A0A931H1E6_9BURK|nr:TonB-dependent receptor [Caenimonas aquaedulcis]MBG9386781.1 TonB-dependent receptor [Caenimonas aquaedulcis]